MLAVLAELGTARPLFPSTLPNPRPLLKQDGHVSTHIPPSLAAKPTLAYLLISYIVRGLHQHVKLAHRSVSVVPSTVGWLSICKVAISTLELQIEGIQAPNAVEDLVRFSLTEMRRKILLYSYLSPKQSNEAGMHIYAKTAGAKLHLSCSTVRGRSVLLCCLFNAGPSRNKSLPPSSARGAVMMKRRLQIMYVHMGLGNLPTSVRDLPVSGGVPGEAQVCLGDAGQSTYPVSFKAHHHHHYYVDRRGPDASRQDG